MTNRDTQKPLYPPVGLWAKQTQKQRPVMLAHCDEANEIKNRNQSGRWRMREKKYHDYSSARGMRQLKISWVNLALIYHPKGNNITNIPYISTNSKGSQGKKSMLVVRVCVLN